MSAYTNMTIFVGVANWNCWEPLLYDGGIRNISLLISTDIMDIGGIHYLWTLWTLLQSYKVLLVPYRLLPDESGRHGQGHDQDRGWTGSQQHSSSVDRLSSHALVHKHPDGEANYQQQADQIGNLRQSTFIISIQPFSQITNVSCNRHELIKLKLWLTC